MYEAADSIGILLQGASRGRTTRILPIVAGLVWTQFHQSIMSPEEEETRARGAVHRLRYCRQKHTALMRCCRSLCISHSPRKETYNGEGPKSEFSSFCNFQYLANFPSVTSKVYIRTYAYSTTEVERLRVYAVLAVPLRSRGPRDVASRSPEFTWRNNFQSTRPELTAPLQKQVFLSLNCAYYASRGISDRCFRGRNERRRLIPRAKFLAGGGERVTSAGGGSNQGEKAMTPSLRMKETDAVEMRRVVIIA